VAHLLTALRLALAFPVAMALARPAYVSAALLVVLLCAAIASDYFDGMVARRLGTASPGGQVFDHGTDWLFVTAGATGAAMVGLIPLVLPILITVAFGQYVIDSYVVHRQKRLRMSAIGRWNGVFYFVPLVVLASARLDLWPWPWFAASLTGAARLISYALIVSTLVSIVDRATAARLATQTPRQKT
jgi:CDP-diacylglycerol--glycerol-3-phosphate 3-phosphatidyltransferase